MKNAQVPVLGFAAYSGTGKTTMLTKLIPLLKNLGLRIGLIKHSHNSFEIDKPGKDSYRLRMAGASPVLLISNQRRATITEFKSSKKPRLDEQLKAIDQSILDLILVEGFKSENFPKIELHRPIQKHPLIFPHDPSIIAIATDANIKISKFNSYDNKPKLQPYLLDINNPSLIAKFILINFLGIKDDKLM